jgi:hypothetical protein
MMPLKKPPPLASLQGNVIRNVIFMLQHRHSLHEPVKRTQPIWMRALNGLEASH